MATETSFKSRLLTTMAILLANYDENRDYLSNFEPFVIDLLKRWPAGEEARPKQLCRGLTESYHLPEIPINTVTQLRDRVQRAGYLVSDAVGRHFPNPEALVGVPSLGDGQTEFLDHFDHLSDSICAYAWDVHGRDWTKEDAEVALESFVEDFSVELAMARRAGDVGGGHEFDGDNAVSRSEALAVVHGFARRALEQDETNIAYLEEVVRASMLANVIYLQNLGSWKPDLDGLVAYLDTTVAFRVLGLTDGEVSEAALQMMDLLREFEVPVRIFDHTLVEMQGVLEGVEGNLRAISVTGKPNLDRLALQGQEVLVHAMRQRWTPADIKEVSVSLERHLSSNGIAVSAVPQPHVRLNLDRRLLDNILLRMGFSESQRQKDAESLCAVDTLREGRSYTELGEAPAILVTSNDRLVKASSLWFQEQGRRSVIPQCTSETSFTTQLWMRKPQGRPDVARKFLIAESFAALNPSPELWDRYLERIGKSRDRREITDEQVKVLVFSTEAKESLVEVAHGDPEQVDGETIDEVLARYETRAPARVAQELEEAQRAIGSLQERNESQTKEILAQRQKIEGLERDSERRREREQRVARRRETARRAVGIGVAVAAIAAVLTIWLGGVVSDPVLKAAACFGSLCLAAGSAAWGLRKSLRWAVALIVSVGAFSALFFGLIAVADHEGPGGGRKAVGGPAE